jgi:hypothetical protein
MGLALNNAQQAPTEPQFSHGARKSVFGGLGSSFQSGLSASAQPSTAGRSFEVGSSSLVVTLSFSTLSLPVSEVAFRAIVALEARPAHPLSSTSTFTAFPGGPNGSIVVGPSETNAETSNNQGQSTKAISARKANPSGAPSAPAGKKPVTGRKKTTK